MEPKRILPRVRSLEDQIGERLANSVVRASDLSVAEGATLYALVLTVRNVNPYPGERRGPLVGKHYRQGHASALLACQRVICELASARMGTDKYSTDPFYALHILSDLHRVHAHGSIGAAIAAEADLLRLAR